MSRRFDATDIRRYYDRHTSSFVTFGQSGSRGAIHRAVWGPGATSREQAFRYVENQILEALRHLSPASHVVDLGCGVGASLCYLAERIPIRGTGITLSPVQARLAEQWTSAARCSDRVRCLVGDYCNLPDSLAPADLAYAIESFVHGPAPDRFFDQCRRLVRPGGLLLICDDFRRHTTASQAAGAIERFRRGWHVNTLLHPEEIHALARSACFEHESTIDLTPYLEIRRWRDRMAELLVALFGWLPLENTSLDYLLGGIALQKCLSQGWIGYDLARFRRVG